jgi:outer membrane protein
MMIRTILGGALLAAAATPAVAQDASLPDPNQPRDTVTIGAGAAYIPDYEGSDDYKITPAAAIRGQLGGIDFWTSGTQLYVDVVPRSSGIDFDAGPIVGVRFNRTGHVKDDFVDALPERKTAVEAGGFAGISLHNLTNPYDTLSLRFDVIKGLSAHKSTLFGPHLSFSTPLSKSFFVSADASLEWAGGGYANYYYSITPADSIVSGLPAYDADGGFKSWKVGLTTAYSLGGDLTRGFTLFGLANYGRLHGDFADSPIVDLRGSRNQAMAALGLGYTF